MDNSVLDTRYRVYVVDDSGDGWLVHGSSANKSWVQRRPYWFPDIPSMLEWLRLKSDTMGGPFIYEVMFGTETHVLHTDAEWAVFYLTYPDLVFNRIH